MSCVMTIAAVKDRTKTVTRRRAGSWLPLKVGDRLTLVEKGQGIPKGGKVVRLAEVEVVSVTIEPLYGITDEEVAREGFPDMDTHEFIEFWLDGQKVAPFATQTEAMAFLVRRIEWRYLDQLELT